MDQRLINLGHSEPPTQRNAETFPARPKNVQVDTSHRTAKLVELKAKRGAELPRL